MAKTSGTVMKRRKLAASHHKNTSWPCIADETLEDEDLEMHAEYSEEGSEDVSDSEVEWKDGDSSEKKQAKNTAKRQRKSSRAVKVEYQSRKECSLANGTVKMHAQQTSSAVIEDLAACMREHEATSKKLRECSEEIQTAEEASVAAMAAVDKQSIDADRAARMELKHETEKLRNLKTEIIALSTERYANSAISRKLQLFQSLQSHFESLCLICFVLCATDNNFTL